MTEHFPEQAELLREALRELREDTPSNRLARSSILASVQDSPELSAVALEEVAWPQAELDLHLTGETVEDHTTRADWFGRFVTRLSLAVQEVTKSMTSSKRLTPSLQVFAPQSGSVRVIVRAAGVEATETSGVEGADDTTAESRALHLVAHLMHLSEEGEIDADSALVAATQSLTPRARQRIRSVTRSVIEAKWEVKGEVTQRGRTLERVRFDAGSAQRLFDELNREHVQTRPETLTGFIDGERRSLSTMWFTPTGVTRAFEVAVKDADLLQEVRRLAAEPDLEVLCEFRVFLTVPAGAKEASSRSRELRSIMPAALARPGFVFETAEDESRALRSDSGPLPLPGPEDSD